MGRPKKANNVLNRRDLTTIVQAYRADHDCINLIVSAYNLTQSDVVRQLLFLWIEKLPESEQDLKSLLLKKIAKEKQSIMLNNIEQITNNADR